MVRWAEEWLMEINTEKCEVARQVDCIRRNSADHVKVAISHPSLRIQHIFHQHFRHLQHDLTSSHLHPFLPSAETTPSTTPWFTHLFPPKPPPPLATAGDIAPVLIPPPSTPQGLQQSFQVRRVYVHLLLKRPAFLPRVLK